MRVAIAPLLLLPFLSASAAVPPPPREAQLATVEDDVVGPQNSPVASPEPAVPDSASATADGSTTFNGVKVPPMKDLTGENFQEETKDGYWFVKQYSPYCPHCIEIAPTWQTLYEYYYTSTPVASTKPTDPLVSLNSFHGFYNFHFASLDCIAWGDICTDHGVKAFPTFQLFKDGQLVKTFEGVKTMTTLSKFLEETLDSIKPGSRPASGPMLPKPGANSSEVGDLAHPSNDLDKGSAESDSPDPHGAAYSDASQARPTSTDKTGQSKKPTATPNAAGQSTNLTPESFQQHVTMTDDPWFIKFHAPWCGHCQAMAPVWAQMAREMQGRLNVGEVNCEVHRRLCRDVHVKAYPTIHYFRGGERVEYEGLRGFGDLVSFAKKALDVGSHVPQVDAAQFKAMEENEDVIFIYFYDKATTDEDFSALDRLTLSLIGHAKLVKTDDKILSDRFKIHSWPRLVVSRNGRPSYYDSRSPKDMRDFRKVLGWMQSVWLPLVPELTAMNSREVMTGRYVVLGVLSRERVDDFLMGKREIKNAALEWMDRETSAFQRERQEQRDSKQLRIEEAEDRNDQRALRQAKQMQITIAEQDRKQVGFAWIDGVYWERWLRTTYGIDVKEGEKVIINDEDNKRYWDTTISGASIVPSRTSILETLNKITADPPKLSPKYTTNKVEQVYFQAKAAMRGRPRISGVLFALGVVFALIWGGRRLRKRRASGGFFQLDGKEGLLGGAPAGKVD